MKNRPGCGSGVMVFNQVQPGPAKSDPPRLRATTATGQTGKRGAVEKKVTSFFDSCRYPSAFRFWWAGSGSTTQTAIVMRLDNPRLR